jgi:hypothetical protein
MAAGCTAATVAVGRAGAGSTIIAEVVGSAVGITSTPKSDKGAVSRRREATAQDVP